MFLLSFSLNTPKNKNTTFIIPVLKIKKNKQTDLKG